MFTQSSWLVNFDDDVVFWVNCASTQNVAILGIFRKDFYK